MSKSPSRKKIANLHTRANGWDTAITDAQEMISDYKDRIDRLNRAITTFTTMRDRGESFPSGTAKKAQNKVAEATILALQ